jgi:histidinol-phosphate aminotransferase
MITVKEHIRALKPYKPGIQPKPGEKVIKLNTNENPYPPSPRVFEAIARECREYIRYYPDPKSLRLRHTIASLYDVPPEWVLCGNGSDEVLRILLRTFTEKGDRIGFYNPSYSYYATLGRIHNLELAATPLGDDLEQPPLPDIENVRLFFLTNPNSPLGFSFSPAFVAEIAGRLKGILVVDEAYADFARSNCLHLLRDHPNIVITRSLSKSYSLAGLRVGFALGSPRWIRQMDKVRDHYNLSRVAQAAACAALEDRRHFEKNLRRVLRTRGRVSAELARRGYSVLPSEANFLFVRPRAVCAARTVYKRLLESGILVRYFDQPGLRDGLRISIGTDKEMDELLGALSAIETRSRGYR